MAVPPVDEPTDVGDDPHTPWVLWPWLIGWAPLCLKSVISEEVATLSQRGFLINPDVFFTKTMIMGLFKTVLRSGFWFLQRSGRGTSGHADWGSGVSRGSCSQKTQGLLGAWSAGHASFPKTSNEAQWPAWGSSLVQSFIDQFHCPWPFFISLLLFPQLYGGIIDT